MSVDSSLFASRPAGHPNVPNVFLNDPANRRIKVVTIGAGVSGILNAYNIQTRCENVEHVIFEKNPDVGGTWYENRYPECGCDVPSHAYAYRFAPNPDWPRFMSKSQDIWQYLVKVCSVFGLRKYMNFNTEVVGCYWQEVSGKWLVKTRQTSAEGIKEQQTECDLVLYATGWLNNWKWPDIEGLKTFKGRVVHTANWPEDYQEKQWANERVAVIGSGASSIQTVPGLQPYVKRMDVYARTAVWFISMTDKYPQNYTYTEEEKRAFRSDPRTIIEHRKFLENLLNGSWPAFYLGSDAQKMISGKFQQRMAQLIKDERLLKGFTPNFALGCRRIAPGDPYLQAIQEDNVDVHFTPVAKITPQGVVGGDGVAKEVDTIVCATGFDVSFRPRFPVIGKNGVDLAEKWRTEPLAYFGLTVPDMPNFMMHGGPPAPVQNGTSFGYLHAVADYGIKMIEKLQREDVKSLAPKQDVTDAFGQYVQDLLKLTVFSDDCRSWYKNNETGKVNAVYPGSTLHYIEMINNPRWEDYNIEYNEKGNMWRFMGIGMVPQQKKHGQDLSYYVHEEDIDPLWLEEIKRAP